MADCRPAECNALSTPRFVGTRTLRFDHRSEAQDPAHRLLDAARVGAVPGIRASTGMLARVGHPFVVTTCARDVAPPERAKVSQSRASRRKCRCETPPRPQSSVGGRTSDLRRIYRIGNRLPRTQSAISPSVVPPIHSVRRHLETILFVGVHVNRKPR